MLEAPYDYDTELNREVAYSWTRRWVTAYRQTGRRFMVTAGARTQV